MTELAWAAGLWDGEGCAYLQKQTLKNGTESRYLSLSMGQCYDPEVLHRFAAAVGIGKVTGPHKSGIRNAPTWKWRACGQPAESVAEALLPHLSGTKTRQIETIRQNTTEPVERVIVKRDSKGRIMAK